MKRLAAAPLFVAFSLLAALAADKPLPRATAPAAGDVSLQGYGDTNKTCQEWTDGCRTCVRQEGGEPVCSNIGPACQPAAISCSPQSAPAQPTK
jgi:hypothetical protein